MTVWKKHIARLSQLALMAALLVPGWAAAQSDLDITMRMVADDEELDSSFVQEMEIPESINELDTAEAFETLDASELSTEAQELNESLSLQARETRDALDTELPGERPAIELPDPGLDSPELPGDGLPGLPVDQLPDTGLDSLQDGGSTLDSVTSQ